MLQAKTKGGKFMTPSLYTETEIARWKEREQFFCPSCHEPVILRAGIKTIPHFAHHAKSNCPSMEGGEGPYHEKGKLLLYQWLKSQRLKVSLETYLPSIHQRPDILLRIHHKTVAIEYQCARISSAEMNKRNEGYLRANITPIWIIGAKRFKRITRHHLKIDQFLRQFIHGFSADSPLTLFFFCPDTIQFTFFHDIYVTTTQHALGIFTHKSLKEMTFIDLFHYHSFNRKVLYTLWKKEKRQFRLRPRNRLAKNELRFYQWLYLRGMNAEQLPSIVHLPVRAQYSMRTSTWNWQSRLCLDYLTKIPIGSRISLHSCEHVLKHHIIPAANYPLISPALNPVYEYLHLLTQSGILQQQSESQFIKRLAIPVYRNIEDALNGDNHLMEQLIKSASIKMKA